MRSEWNFLYSDNHGSQIRLIRQNMGIWGQVIKVICCNDHNYIYSWFLTFVENILIGTILFLQVLMGAQCIGFCI